MRTLGDGGLDSGGVEGRNAFCFLSLSTHAGRSSFPPNANATQNILIAARYVDDEAPRAPFSLASIHA